MTSIRSLALLMTLLSLAACEQSANPPPQPKTPVVQVQPAKPPAEKQSSEKPPATVSRSTTAPEPTAVDRPQSSVQDKPSAPEPEPAAALDLSLHPNVFDPLQPLEPINDLSTPLLPPLFGEKVQPDSPFQLNGKLITNERDEDYWQSVEGAQLQFEFKH
ncbi:MAG: hypothetical protein KKD30_08435 [Gammaproteobacteria bacterium]|nr:hypothetical protein [Gammaproteobacteria bacterium]MBU0882897.1 hypothetical protein [Gammaproteobacteria bacterium]MBU1859972.1 hypothetical protein [Gammaproteobacteria bacterium]